MAIKTVGEDLEAIRQKKHISIEELTEGVYSERNFRRIISGASRGNNELLKIINERLNFETDLSYGSKFDCKENFEWYHLFIQVRFYLENGFLNDGIFLLKRGMQEIGAMNTRDYQEYLLLYIRILLVMEENLQAKDVIAFAETLFPKEEEQREKFYDNEVELTMLNFYSEKVSRNKDEILEKEQYFLSLLAKVKTQVLQESLQKELVYAIARALFDNGLYQEALAYLAEHQKGVSEDIILILYRMLEGLCYCRLGNEEKGYELLKQATVSAAAANTYYYVKVNQALKKELSKEILFEDNPELLQEICYQDLGIDIPCEIIEYPKGMFALNDIISMQREKRNITLNQLAYGLMTKKSLIYFEKGQQKISATILQTLLERLGISADYFTIYGKDREAKYYQCWMKVLSNRIVSKDSMAEELKELEMYTDHSNPVEEQFYKWALYKAGEINFANTREEIDYLIDVLSITIPDFDIYNIQNYLLSQHEFKLIITIAQLYLFAQTDKANEGMYYLDQLLRYVEHNEYDIMSKKYTEGILVANYVRNIYRNTIQTNIDFENRILKKKSVCSNLKYMELSYFYYVQARNNIFINEQIRIHNYNLQNQVPKIENCSEEIHYIERYFDYACMLGDLLGSINTNNLRNDVDMKLFHSLVTR